MTKSKSKSKDKPAPKRAKKSETGLPKEVAGVKVPKAVRKSGALAALFNSDLGRELVADALIAAAGAAAAALTRNRTARNAAGNATSLGTEIAQTAAGAVAGVVTEAAKTLLPPALVSGSTEDSRGRSEERSGGNGSRQRYVQLASETSARRTSRKPEKGEPRKR